MQGERLVAECNALLMPLIVQKFGGTSVADSQKILAAARKAVRAQQEGNQVVMVVSAMGHNTDVLVDLAREITDQPPAREMDMLLSTGEQVSVALMAMAIQSLGYQAISLTGAQIGIKTDSTHTKARIHSISTDRMRRALGRRQDRHRRRLPGDRRGLQHHHARPRRQRYDGRGAGGRAGGRRLRNLHRRRRRLHDRPARCCPRPAACKQVSYDEMLELASLGAGVMHSRSIEFAKKFSVPIHVRTSFSDVPGTMIVAAARGAGSAGQRRDAGEERSPRDDPGRARPAGHEPGDLLEDRGQEHLGRHDRAERRGRRRRPTFRSPSPKDELPATLEAVEAAADELGAEGVSHDDDVAKISVVGLGMATQTGVAQRMFRALADAGVNILMITHQRDQNLGAGQPRSGGRRRCGPCTARSSWTRRRSRPARRLQRAGRSRRRRHRRSDCSGRSSPGCKGWKT